MQIGAMNNPQRDVLDEIRWMADMGLDFIDLTLEPPAAATWKVDPERIHFALERARMGIIGHTAYYLPIGSPFESLRKAAVAELKTALGLFSQIGVRWMNLHPDRYAPLHERPFIVKRDLQSIRELMDAAAQVGIGLMIENLPGDFNTVEQLADLLEPVPELGLHLDIGHANLLTTTNTADEIIRVYINRLRHVHLHDNKGGAADLHLPLGVGTMNVARHVRTLKAAGYDGTITLEVFSEDRKYLGYSRDILRRLWDSASAVPAVELEPAS